MQRQIKSRGTSKINHISPSGNYEGYRKPYKWGSDCHLHTLEPPKAACSSANNRYSEAAGGSQTAARRQCSRSFELDMGEWRTKTKQTTHSVVSKKCITSAGRWTWKQLSSTTETQLVHWVGDRAQRSGVQSSTILQGPGEEAWFVYWQFLAWWAHACITSLRKTKRH